MDLNIPYNTIYTLVDYYIWFFSWATNVNFHYNSFSLEMLFPKYNQKEFSHAGVYP